MSGPRVVIHVSVWGGEFSPVMVPARWLLEQALARESQGTDLRAALEEVCKERFPEGSGLVLDLLNRLTIDDVIGRTEPEARPCRVCDSRPAYSVDNLCLDCRRAEVEAALMEPDQTVTEPPVAVVPTPK